MNCLENLVGLSDCVASDAPFLINDIGFDVNQMTQLMDASYANVEDFFTAQKRTAARLIQSDLLSMLPQQMKASTVLESRTVGMYPDQRKVFTGTGNAGIKQSFHNSSDFLKVRIKNIRLFTDHTGNVTVNIYNLTTGQLAGTVTVAALPGQIISTECDIEVSSAQQDLNLFIGYDTTGITSYNGQLFSSGCCGKTNRFSSGFCTFTSGKVASPFTLSDFSSQSNTPGLSFDYEIVCDSLQWFCIHKGLFGMAMLYKTAVCALENALDSGSQFSNQQTTNYEKNVSRIETATNHYNDQIQKALRSMKFPRNKCFTCETVTIVQSNLPG